MKYYLDIAGLLIGGYAAWFVLGLTGATKTPVWTPNRNKSASSSDGSNFDSSVSPEDQKN